MGGGLYAAGIVLKSSALANASPPFPPFPLPPNWIPLAGYRIRATRVNLWKFIATFVMLENRVPIRWRAPLLIIIRYWRVLVLFCLARLVGPVPSGTGSGRVRGSGKRICQFIHSVAIESNKSIGSGWGEFKSAEWIQFGYTLDTQWIHGGAMGLKISWFGRAIQSAVGFVWNQGANIEHFGNWKRNRICHRRRGGWSGRIELNINFRPWFSFDWYLQWWKQLNAPRRSSDAFKQNRQIKQIEREYAAPPAPSIQLPPPTPTHTQTTSRNRIQFSLLHFTALPIFKQSNQQRQPTHTHK